MTRKLKTWGVFVRDYLLNKGEAYIQEIWRAYNLYLMQNGYRSIEYPTMRKYIWILRKLGLITNTRIEYHEDPHGYLSPRVFIKIVEGKENDEAWYNPQKAYNPEWALGSRRYVRKTKKKETRRG